MKISDFFRLEKERKPIVLKDLTKFGLYRVCGYDARPGWRNGGFFVVDVELGRVVIIWHSPCATVANMV